MVKSVIYSVVPHINFPRDKEEEGGKDLTS